MTQMIAHSLYVTWGSRPYPSIRMNTDAIRIYFGFARTSPTPNEAPMKHGVWLFSINANTILPTDCTSLQSSQDLLLHAHLRHLMHVHGCRNSVGLAPYLARVLLSLSLSSLRDDDKRPSWGCALRLSLSPCPRTHCHTPLVVLSPNTSETKPIFVGDSLPVHSPPALCPLPSAQIS